MGPPVLPPSFIFTALTVEFDAMFTSPFDAMISTGSTTITRRCPVLQPLAALGMGCPGVQ